MGKITYSYMIQGFWTITATLTWVILGVMAFWLWPVEVMTIQGCKLTDEWGEPKAEFAPGDTLHVSRSYCADHSMTGIALRSLVHSETKHEIKLNPEELRLVAGCHTESYALKLPEGIEFGPYAYKVSVKFDDVTPMQHVTMDIPALYFNLKYHIE